MATKQKDPREIKEPKKNPDDADEDVDVDIDNIDGVDIDDASIEEPRDDAFRKSPKPAQAPKQRRKKA